MRKRGVLSLWKVLLILFASFVGLGGATALTLYLTGQFDEKVVAPENMAISTNVDGECVYNMSSGVYEISGNSKLMISSTTEGVTKTKVTLSFKNAREVTELKNGMITDGNIVIPKTVSLNKQFDVSVNTTYNTTIKQNWATGGTSVIVASSESNDKVQNQTFTVAVDVPVYQLKLKVAGTDSTEETQKVVVSTTFGIETLFTPTESEYLYNDSTRKKNVYITTTGSGITYDEENKVFTANQVSGSNFPTVTAYVFRNAYYQNDYLKTHENATTDDIIAYLNANKDKSVSKSINIQVVSVSVDSVDFSVSGTTANVFVDKNYRITANSTNGDKTLGVDIKDSQGTSLPALYNRVGIKLSNELEGVKIVGGSVVRKSSSGISIIDYDETFDYIADTTAEYYVLPNVLPKNPNDYYWNLSATNAVEGVLKLNFFYDGENGLTQYNDEDEEFAIVVSNNINETPVGWVKGHEGKITLSVTTGADGEPVSTSIDLANEISPVEEANTYKLVKYFLYSDGGTSVNIEDIFDCESGVSYSEFYNGEPFTITGNIFELKNGASKLQALRSFEGAIKIVAAIVRTDVNGTPYKDNGRYVIVNLSRAREVAVDGVLSISQMTSSFKFNGIERSQDGKYYVPSVSKTETMEDNILVFFELELRSNDYASDTEKVKKAYADGKLQVVCLDENGNVNPNQYVKLVGLAQEENDDGTIVEGMFIGGLLVDNTLISATNARDGLYVALQLQYTDGVETYTQDVEQSDGSLNDHFYVYYQIPTTFERPDEFIDLDLSENGVVNVNLNQASGITGTWDTNVGGTVNIDKEVLQQYLKIVIYDQKGVEIKTSDGIYKLNYVEEDGNGNVAQEKYLSVSSDGKINFVSTNGVPVTTYLSIYVEDAVTDKTEITQYISVPTITFVVTSEGVSSVKYDASTDVESNNLQETQDISEIEVRKYVKSDDIIQLESLFEIYTTSGEKATSYKVYLDNTFVSSFASKSEEIMKMIAFNEDASVEGAKLSDYVGAEIDKIRINVPFRQDTTIKFNIIDTSESELYNITLNLVLLTDIKVNSNFEEYQQSYSDVLVRDRNRNYAISIFGNETYDLDHYLKFVDNKYSWSSITTRGIEVSSLLVDKSSTGIASLMKNELDSKIYLKISDVKEFKAITIVIYYGAVSSYAFSVELSLYVNPNIAAVMENSNFIDLSTLTTKEIGSVYKFYKLTDYRSGTLTQITTPFTFQNVSKEKYISVNETRITAGETQLDYKIGETYTQKLRVLYKNNGVDSPLDFVVIDGDVSTTAEEGAATLEFTVGYFDQNPEEMIKAMIPGARIFKYNGEYAILVLANETVLLDGNFQVAEVKEGSCLNDADSSKIETYTSIEKFIYFDEYVVIETKTKTLKVKIPVIVSKIGDVFAKYDNKVEDLAVLLGDYTTLQDENIYQNLYAGQDFTILTNAKTVGNDYGFYYDRDKAYAGNNNEPRIEIVENADGYIAGIAEVVNGVLKIKDSAVDVFVVLKITLSNLEGTITYSYFYRVKVVANLDQGSVVYPYADDAEYLDMTHQNIVTTYEYDAEEKTFTVDLAREFDVTTKKYECERFNFSGEVLVFNLATEYEEGKVYYKIVEEEIVLADGLTPENFASGVYFTLDLENIVNSHVNSIHKVYIDGKESSDFSEYLNITINQDILNITVINTAKKYDVVVARTYYSNRGEIVGSTIFYTFKISQSATYSYSVDITQVNGTVIETLVENNGVFTYNIDAGQDAVLIKSSLKKVSSSGVETPIENIVSGVVSTEADLATIDLVDNDKYIRFKPSETIEKEGKVNFYMFGEDRIAFIVVVNVNSYYKFNLISEQVESGKEYNFSELFALTNSKDGDLDVTNSVVLNFKDSTDSTYLMIDNSNNKIELPYLAEEKTFTLLGSITEQGGATYNFEFTFTASAKSPQTKSGYTNKETHYGKTSFEITTQEIIDATQGCFSDLGSGTIKFKLQSAQIVYVKVESPVAEKLGDYYEIVDENYVRTEDTTIVPEKEYFEPKETYYYDSITETPQNVANDGYLIKKQLTVVYIWGEYEREFALAYDYTINKNVQLNVNYPKPDGNTALTAEYIKNGTTINLDEAALFATGARVVCTDVVAGISKDVKIEVKNVANVTYDNANKNISFALIDTSKSGSATVVVTINSVVVEYNVIVVDREVVSASLNQTNYNDNVEKIYLEDVAGYVNKEFFAENRILNFKFNSRASAGSTYYIKMLDNSTQTYITFAVIATGNVQNFDMGNVYANMTYVGVFNSSESATSGTNALNNIFDVEPNVTSRIVFKYAEGTQIAGVTTYVNSVGINSQTPIDEKITFEVYYKKGNNDPQKIKDQTYNIMLTTEFDVANALESKDNYVLKELDAIGANATLPSLFEMTEFGFTNTRTNTAYTKNALKNSTARINLEIYGFAALKIEGDTLQKQLHDKLIEEGYKTGLTPRAKMTINTEVDTSSNTLNYITISGDVQNGKDVDFKIHAQGADNNGNHVLMKLSYNIIVDGVLFSKSFDLLFKVNPNASVYFNNRAITGGVEINAKDKIDRISNLYSPIVVKNGEVADNERKLYSETSSDIVTYLYGSTTYNSASMFKYNVGAKETINNHEFNADAGISVSDEVPGKITMNALHLGEKYYFIDGENDFGFKVRVYYRLDGDVVPTMTLTSSTLKEGQDLALGLVYKEVSTSTISIKESEGSTAEEYQEFSSNKALKSSALIKSYSGFSPDERADIRVIISVTDAYTHAPTSTNTSGAYSGRAYSTIDASSNIVNTTWKTLDGVTLLKVVGSTTANWTMDPSTAYTMSVAFKKGGTADPKLLNEIFALEKTTDTSRAADKIYYDASGVVSESTTMSTLYEKIDFTATYTKGSDIAPTPDDNNFTGEVARFGGIDAYAVDSSIGYLNNAQVESFKSKISGFTVDSVRFEKDGQEIGKTESGGQFFTTDGKVFYVAGQSSYIKVAGQKYGNATKVVIPFMNGYYFGTGRTITGVRMIVTIKDGSGETADLVQIITVEKGETEPGLFASDSVVDGGGPTLRSSYIGEVLNDTFEVTLAAGASVKFRFNQEWTEGSPVEGEYITLTNNKSYAVTEYVGITSHLKGITQNIENGSQIEIEVSGGFENVSFRYNGNPVAISGTTGTISIQSYPYSNNPKITLNINDVSEIPSTLTANSCVSRQLYFVYSQAHNDNSETIDRYQIVKTFKVYPITYAIDAEANYKDANGNIIIEVANTDYTYGTENESTYYVVPREKWENHIKLLYGTSQTNIHAETHKFIFEINNSSAGGAGSAFIDERGLIITQPGFTVTDNTITVNIYVKVSGNNGLFETEKGIFIGRVRISLKSGTVNQGTSAIITNAETQASETFKSRAYQVSATNVINIKELFDAEHHVDGSVHYHVVSDTVGNATPKTYVRDNIDSFIFAEVGVHTLKIVRTVNGVVQDYFNATFYIYDTSVLNEKSILLSAGNAYTFNGEDTSCLIVKENGTVESLTTKTFNESGKHEVSFIEVKSGELRTYRFTFYVTTDSAATSVSVAKTANEQWNLSNLDSNGVEFYRYSLNGNEITQFDKIKSEQNVTGDTSSVKYIVLYSDGSYARYSVSYSIIANAETQRYVLLNKSSTFENAIKGDLDNSNAEIFVIDASGKLTRLTSSAKIEDTLSRYTLKTMVNIGTTHYRYTYNFTAYEQLIELTKPVSNDSTIVLSNYNEEIVGKVNEGKAEADKISGNVAFFRFDNSNGQLTSTTIRQFETVTDPIVDTYYVSIGEHYFLVKITFYK